MRKSQQVYSLAANDVAAERSTFPNPLALEDLVQVAARALNVPLALVVLDTAACGPRATVGASADDPWVRDNAEVDLARLIDPRIAQLHGLAFYAAVPLRNAGDARVGTLAVLDRAARSVSEEDLATLQRLARIASALRTQ